MTGGEGEFMIEGLRQEALGSIFRMPTFAKNRAIWGPAVDDLTDNMTNPDAIYNLGGKLGQVFAMTGETGRDQSSLSGGGAAWEGLVCWYLNTVMTGTRAVVVKQSMSLVPKVVSNAMTVTYKNVRTNTESDLTGIILPDHDEILEGVYQRGRLNELISANLGRTSTHSIQCKTNWNDNAQIPMLWDMVYQFRDVKSHSVRIGIDGVDLDDFEEFTYSFVTVPTGKKIIKPNSMQVHRVHSLSGGNYWGRPSESGVAESISEIFKRVFKRAFSMDVRSHIKNLVDNGGICRLTP